MLLRRLLMHLALFLTEHPLVGPLVENPLVQSVVSILIIFITAIKQLFLR